MRDIAFIQEILYLFTAFIFACGLGDIWIVFYMTVQ
jgi:hypothetical protein